MYLGWVFSIISFTVCIAIALLLAVAISRKRLPEDDRKIGHEGVGLRWIYLGTGISICMLFAMAMYALVTLNQATTLPAPPLLTLTVTGYDWWWKVEYNDGDAAYRFVTANEIHIPVGSPVLIMLNSADVIHAFWVPMLAGKTQMIPGLTNQQWIQADVPGVYRGQCTQYCGVQHAHMAFEVVAQMLPDFRAWQAAQLAPSKPPSDPGVAAGQKLFVDRCGACHAIRGTEAAGAHAPDLTHLLSRRLIAAGLLINTPEHLLDWVAHAQQLKPGSRMPSIALAPAEAAELSAFLSTLN